MGAHSLDRRLSFCPAIRAFFGKSSPQEEVKSKPSRGRSGECILVVEDDAEVRRLSIMNAGNRVRELEITSYSELVLAPPAADTAHPAFSKLFVQTEYVAKVGAILATRRRR